MITEYPQFFTATNLEWKKLLKPEKYKSIIVDSLRFMVENKRVLLYAFVIMENHLHLIWQMQAGMKAKDAQRDFLKYTAQRIQDDLKRNHPKVLKKFEVNAKDRKYQFWERNALSIELRSEKVLLQKLKYLHDNPVKAGMSKYAEEYKYSSASFYHTGVDNWGFLFHWSGN